jgi:hypothetical protein
LKRIESEAFARSSFPVVIPSTILFLAFDAVGNETEIKVEDPSCCPELDRWLQLRRLGIRGDFRRIQRVDSGLLCLRDYAVNLSGFEERSIIGESGEVPNSIYHRVEDQFLVFVKSIPLLKSVDKSQMKNEIENLINLHHPCIAAPIGFVFPDESAEFWELKLVELYSEGCSLEEIISTNPPWWTPTVKAKVIVGIVLCLRFAHSLGLLHGSLNLHNILFDSDHRIQISDFGLMQLEAHGMESEATMKRFWGEGWTPKTDIRAFASILFEIVVGQSVKGESPILTDVPEFISSIIEADQSPQSITMQSFHDIFEILELNDFQIIECVDSAEVSAFVNWVESAEHLEK